MPPMPDLQALVAAVRSAPGLLGKRDIGVIERLGGTIDGDDAALVEYRGEYLVVCGEAISPQQTHWIGWQQARTDDIYWARSGTVG